MSKTCIKCGYERTEADAAKSPDECPRCGVIYWKVEAAAAAKAEQAIAGTPRFNINWRPVVIAVVAMVVVGGLGYGVYRYAENSALEKRLASYHAERESLAKLFMRFVEARDLATSTSRIALATPVAAMQALKREATELQLEPCLAGARNTLVHSMTSSIDGFLAFMRQESQAGYFAAEQTLFVEYSRQAEACSPLHGVAGG